MTNQIELIKELLSYIDKYQNTTDNINIIDFSHYLNKQILQSDVKNNNNNPKNNFDKNNYRNFKQYSEVEFSTLLTNLYRFAKHYIKKAFINTDIKTIDEFGFLASLLRQKSLLKKDLINQHLLKTSSGSEIMKRLKSKELIKESACSSDKRARLVSLTPKGAETVMASFDEMHKVSEIIIGNLTEDELEQSLKIFNKLNDFHQHIYKENKDSSLTKIHLTHIDIGND